MGVRDFCLLQSMQTRSGANFLQEAGAISAGVKCSMMPIKHLPSSDTEVRNMQSHVLIPASTSSLMLIKLQKILKVTLQCSASTLYSTELQDDVWIWKCLRRSSHNGGKFLEFDQREWGSSRCFCDTQCPSQNMNWEPLETNPAHYCSNWATRQTYQLSYIWKETKGASFFLATRSCTFT